MISRLFIFAILVGEVAADTNGLTCRKYESDAARKRDEAAYKKRYEAMRPLDDDFAAMASLFSEGYQIHCRPLFLYNAGQAYLRAAQANRARIAFTRFLEVSPQAVEKDEVRRILAELAAK